MKYFFTAMGSIGGLDYFTIVTDTEQGLNQAGVDIRYHHFFYDRVTDTVREIDYTTISMKTNVTVHNSDGSVLAISDLVTEDYVTALYYRLHDLNPTLKGLGAFATMPIATRMKKQR